MATIAVPAFEPAKAAPKLASIGSALLASGLATALTVANLGADPRVEPDAWSVLRGAVVASYAIAGAYTWWRRPSSRFGAFLVAVGIFYAVASLSASESSVLHSFGRVTHAFFLVVLAYVFLCFPHDRLTSELDRRLVEVLGISTAAAWLVAVPLVETLPTAGPLVACADACPDNAFRLVTMSAAASEGISLVVNLVAALCLVSLAAVLVGRARSPSRLRRRLVVPLLAAVTVLALNYAAFTVLMELGVDGIGPLRAIGAASALAIPVAVLVGQVRGRILPAASLGRLVSGVGGEPLTPSRVEQLLRDALGDPELTLALRGPGSHGWVDVRGQAVVLPTGRPDVGITRVTRDGRTYAAVVHDSTLDESTALAEGLAATALVLLENAQLVKDLRDSRARIVASAQLERLRLERNLHDGAQQRLLAIQLKLSAARSEVDGGQLGRQLDEVGADAAAAVEELRMLAHGLYPTVLRDRGLADGIAAAAQTAVTPVDVVDRGVPRCEETVEEAVYYCVLEALANVAKHAGPGARATVSLERAGRDLQFAVVDDGAGFETDATYGGTGLVGMRDRIGAVGGDVEISSDPGGGTAVRGVVAGCWPAPAGAV